MTRPGPKPIDVPALKKFAAILTTLFLHLRDGRDGQIIRLERVPRTRLPDGRVISLKEYRAEGGLGDGEVVDHGGDVIVKIVPAKAPASQSPRRQAQFESRVRGSLSRITADPRFKAKSLWVQDPVFPRPHLWQQLKEASSAAEMKRVTVRIARWASRYAHPRWRRDLREHAVGLFEAKQNLWTYPRSDRASSDNKRVEFFGKALAALILGISPATGTRKLLRWSPLKPPSPPAPPLRARGPSCPHCGATEVQGFESGTVVRCPGCGERYYIAQRRKNRKNASG